MPTTPQSQNSPSESSNNDITDAFALAYENVKKLEAGGMVASAPKLDALITENYRKMTLASLPVPLDIEKLKIKYDPSDFVIGGILTGRSSPNLQTISKGSMGVNINGVANTIQRLGIQELFDDMLKHCLQKTNQNLVTVHSGVSQRVHQILKPEVQATTSPTGETSLRLIFTYQGAESPRNQHITLAFYQSLLQCANHLMETVSDHLSEYINQMGSFPPPSTPPVSKEEKEKKTEELRNLLAEEV